MSTAEPTLTELIDLIRNHGVTPSQEDAKRLADAAELAMAIPRLEAYLKERKQQLVKRNRAFAGAYGEQLADVNNVLCMVQDHPEVLR